MNLNVTLTVFPLVFLGELPDKTMFASLVMASRGRPLLSWLGTVVGFAVHVVIAVSVGVAAFMLFSHRVLDVAVAIMFIAGAVFAYRSGGDKQKTAALTPATAFTPSGLRTAAASAGVIFVAEWGDLTQIVTVNLAARYHDAFSVGVGALVALATVSAIASFAGQGLLRIVPARTLSLVTALVLVVLGAFSLVAAL